MPFCVHVREDRIVYLLRRRGVSPIVRATECFGRSWEGQAKKSAGDPVAVPRRIVDQRYLLVLHFNARDCDLLSAKGTSEGFAVGVRNVEILIGDRLEGGGLAVDRPELAICWRENIPCARLRALEALVGEPGVTAASVDHHFECLRADLDFRDEHEACRRGQDRQRLDAATRIDNAPWSVEFNFSNPYTPST